MKYCITSEHNGSNPNGNSCCLVELKLSNMCRVFPKHVLQNSMVFHTCSSNRGFQKPSYQGQMRRYWSRGAVYWSRGRVTLQLGDQNRIENKFYLELGKL